MLQFFKNNTPFTVIILFIFALLVKLNVLFHPVAPVPLAGHLFYNGVIHVLDYVFLGKGFAYTLLAIIMLFLQALYLNNITNRYKIYHKPTYLPAFTYILLTSLYPAFNYFSITLFVVWALLGGMDFILGLSQTTRPRTHIFNGAFLFSLAAVFQFSAIAFLILFVISFLIFRPFNIGEWSVAIMGYLTPFYFFICILFLADSTGLLRTWFHIGFSFPVHITAIFYFVLCIIGLSVLFGGGVYAMQLQLPRTSIYVRRNWISIIICLIASAAVAVCTDVFVTASWLITIPALSLFITNVFTLEKSKGFSNFMFYFSIILIVLCQLVYK